MRISSYNSDKAAIFISRSLKYTGLFCLTILCLSLMTSCDKNNDDEPESGIENPGSGNGGGQGSFSLNQLKGHWVEQEEWRIQQADIRSVDGSTMFSSDVISGVTPVEGFYIDASSSVGYDLYIEATTTKYANNDVAGNKVIKSWNCIDGKTVYVMNVSGSRNKGTCGMNGDRTFLFRTSSYTVVSTSEMKGPYGKTYIKVNL